MTDWIESRIRPWEIVSKSYNDRKTLTNTLLISKLNYSLPFLFGLEEANFKKIQGIINNFIFKKRIYPGKGKFCNKKKGGLGAPNL